MSGPAHATVSIALSDWVAAQWTAAAETVPISWENDGFQPDTHPVAKQSGYVEGSVAFGGESEADVGAAVSGRQWEQVCVLYLTALVRPGTGRKEALRRRDVLRGILRAAGNRIVLGSTILRLIDMENNEGLDANGRWGAQLASTFEYDYAQP